MSKQRKGLWAISILLLVLGIVLVVFAVAGMGLGAAGLPSFDGNLDEGLLNETSDEGLMLLLFFAGVGALILGVPFVIIGALGMRGAKHPSKIVPFMFFCVVGIVVGVGLLMELVQAGSFGVTSVVGDLVAIAIPAVAFMLANAVRAEREDVAPGQVAGPDGPQYPDGYNPKKLGFMRVMEVVFILNTLFTLVDLAVLGKGQYALSFDQVLNLINLIFDALLLWFIWQRSSATRPYAIGFALFNIIVGTGYNLIAGNFEVFSQLLLCGGDIIILFYFITSRRAAAILVQDFSVERRDERIDEANRTLFQPKTWAFWRNVIIFFCVFCVVGHWMEAAFCLLIKYGIVDGIYDPNSQIWHDWLYPFPVYGFGTVACILLLYPVKNFLQKKIRNMWGPLVVSFLVNMFVCAVIELILGFTQNQPVNGVYPLWDYSNMPFNFMGQICLQNTAAFGAVATLMTWLVYPALEGLIHKLPNNVANGLFVAVGVGFIILTSLYLVDLSKEYDEFAGNVVEQVEDEAGEDTALGEAAENAAPAPSGSSS